MKFKFLVIILNIIIIFFLSAIALIPLVLFGTEFAAMFWRSSWPLAGILLAALTVLNVFFMANRRLFWLMEREDWPALTDYLEQDVLGKGRYSPRKIKLLLNSYLVMSDSAAVLRLENKLAFIKPALLEANALVLGAARILGGDPLGAAEFFQIRISRAAARDSQWLRWYCGFSYTLASAFPEAEAEFKSLAPGSPDALVAGLSAYFLATTLQSRSADPSACDDAVREGRERVRAALKGAAGWKKEAAKVRTEVYAVIIKKYIDEAGIWLFS